MNVKMEGRDILIQWNFGYWMTLKSNRSEFDQKIWVKNASVSDQIFNFRTHESNRWKRNARKWLPKPNGYDQIAGRVYPRNIVSVVEYNFGTIYVRQPRFHLFHLFIYLFPYMLITTWSNNSIRKKKLTLPANVWVKWFPHKLRIGDQ